MARAQTIGLDIAKDVFQVHGINSSGRTVVRRQLKRDELESFFKRRKPCLVGIEATSSSHYWARQLRKSGHSVRLIHPNHAKAYVKSQKNDPADAEAICDAVQRPNMRFIPIKSERQQALLIVHSTRDLLVREYTMAVSALRSHLCEFGVVRSSGTAGRSAAIAFAVSPALTALPPAARKAIRLLVDHIRRLREDVRLCEVEIARWHDMNPQSRRLATIPFVGKVTASAIVSAVGDFARFRSGRDFAAWIGLVPKQYSSGGRSRLGRISKRGNSYLRKLLYIAAHGIMRHAPLAKTVIGRWAAGLRKRKPRRVATVALAAKLARIMWSMLKHKTRFNCV
jgi:transposase